MLNRGEFGLDGFIHFMKFFAIRVEKGSLGRLFETKVEVLLNEMKHGASHPLKTTTPPSTCGAIHHNVKIIDIDKLEKVVAKVGKQK